MGISTAARRDCPCMTRDVSRPRHLTEHLDLPWPTHTASASRVYCSSKEAGLVCSGRQERKWPGTPFHACLDGPKRLLFSARRVTTSPADRAPSPVVGPSLPFLHHLQSARMPPDHGSLFRAWWSIFRRWAAFTTATCKCARNWNTDMLLRDQSPLLHHASPVKVRHCAAHLAVPFHSFDSCSWGPYANGCVALNQYPFAGLWW